MQSDVFSKCLATSQTALETTRMLKGCGCPSPTPLNCLTCVSCLLLTHACGSCYTWVQGMALSWLSSDLLVCFFLCFTSALFLTLLNGRVLPRLGAELSAPRFPLRNTSSRTTLNRTCQWLLCSLGCIS